MLRTIALIMIVLAGAGAPAVAQTDTTFTYQGELKENGNPAAGSFNMSFSLWNALSGGSQVGATVSAPVVQVTNGRFTVALDFGAAAFDNSSRWLTISVNGQILLPRQPLNRAPYAMQTRGIFVNGSDKIGIGTTTPAGKVHLRGDGSESVLRVTNGGSGGTAIAVPDVVGAGDGIGLYGITSGELITAHNDGSGKAASFTRGNVTVTNGFVGIGTSSPSRRLQVLEDEIFEQAVYVYNSGDAIVGVSDVYSGVTGITDDQFGSGVYAVATAESGQTKGIYATCASPEGIAVFGQASSVNGGAKAVLGSCNSSNGWDFYAAGPGINYGASSSIRWKDNIEPLRNPLDMLRGLRGVRFDWDAEHGGHHDVGMIAEEVGAVLPEIVNYEANGIDANGMDYSKLTPLLVEAVNALRAEKDAEIADLHQRLAQKDAQLLDLAQRIAALERAIESPRVIGKEHVK